MSRQPPADLLAQADAWARSAYGEDARVARVTVLPGHAGLTYGLDVVDGSGSAVPLVLRVPPAGVRRQGSTDVLRQAPLLDALLAAGLPVARVVAASEDEAWFGVPFLVVERVAGRNVSIDSGGEPPQRAHYLAAASALAQLHRVRWAESLTGWSSARGYFDEVLAWDRALGRALDEPWHPTAVHVRDALLRQAPQDVAMVLTHGDYQFSNLLFEGVRLTAVLDWEISGIGPGAADLGWFLVINDPHSWAHPVFVGARPSDDELVSGYAAVLGSHVSSDELRYSCALAAYRFAVITALNLSLHRTGRRVDAHWETLEPSIPVLLTRAQDELSSRG
jgi:aminoglycoside phosphotransferase (APT) family kinase protein